MTRQEESAAASVRQEAADHRTPWAAMILDVLLVTLFALIGRTSHAEGLTAAGVSVTALPFLAGTVVAWALLVSSPWAPRPASWQAGVLVVLITVAVGMALRAVASQGVAVSFVVVALIANAIFLIGWRLLGAYLVSRFP